MIVHFFLKVTSLYGQSLWIKAAKKSAEGTEVLEEIELEYLNNQYWHKKIDFSDCDNNTIISYHYFLKENGLYIKNDFFHERVFEIISIHFSLVNIFDEWQNEFVASRVFETKAFNLMKESLPQSTDKKIESQHNYTHIFNVYTPLLKPGKVLCLLGSDTSLNKWKTDQPILLQFDENKWQVHLDLSKAVFPIEYKFGIYDLLKNTFEEYETGPNRVIEILKNYDSIGIYNQYIEWKNFSWRGVGINVQLTSLRTPTSGGVGDFMALKLLVDWCKQTGIKMIQLLPINDTVSKKTVADTYPYSAISAYAIHPIFMNLDQLAKYYSCEIPEELFVIGSLLDGKKTIQYNEVLDYKLKYCESIYDRFQDDFLQDKKFQTYFNTQKDWLTPYAVFCYCRDINNTADFNNWTSLSVFDEEIIKEISNPKSEYFNKIAFYYFIQFHLYLQCIDSFNYAHENGIVMKGDLPIGVGRYSVETWKNPTFFKMEMQSGAPPDAFSEKGQNWNFPTYNWNEMSKDNFAWWKKRLSYMAEFFDAIRIDHVLGFFRIWSIPMHSLDGLMCYFDPAAALTEYDFSTAGISFNRKRFCTPYITDELLIDIFKEDTQWIKENVIIQNEFTSGFNTQKKVDDYFIINPQRKHVKPSIFNLLSNVILLIDQEDENCFHFRIDMQKTASFKALTQPEQLILLKLYHDYFYSNQNDLWKDAAVVKLKALQNASNMLLCAEDLGMVPDIVENVLGSEEILALQVQRMPKNSNQIFSRPFDAPYLSVVTPSTHDMSTLREWWWEDDKLTEYFYKNELQNDGNPPKICTPQICEQIIEQHLQSPAMWSVFLLQDILSMDENVAAVEPSMERINIPSDAQHVWNYRMHIQLEDLIQQHAFNEKLLQMIVRTNRN